MPRLPEEVQRQGLETKKVSPSILMAVNINSSDGTRDLAYIMNYARTQVRDPLSRLEGIGDVDLMAGGHDYSIRVWIDPNRAAQLDLTPSEKAELMRVSRV